MHGWDKEIKRCYNRHRNRVEGAHGEAKTQHGLRRAVRRGLDNVAIQVYLTAAVMNLKRLAARLRLIYAMGKALTSRYLRIQLQAYKIQKYFIAYTLPRQAIFIC